MIATMNYVPSCMWDELCLLLAKDEGLHDDMNTVCNILEGDSPDGDTASPKSQRAFDSTTPPATPTLRPSKQRKRPHFDVRQRQEMFLLRREVDILRKHLSASQTKVKRPFEMTKWEKAAKNECIEKNRSLQENEQLKEAVHQQATLIQQMEKLCHKKMRLAADDAEAWQNYRLAAHESLRVVAIHAIADRQYRRMQNTFIQAGVFGCTKDSFRARVTQQNSKCVVMELANHVTLRAPFRVVSSAAWRVIGGPDAYMMTQGSIETTDFVDRHTVYSRAMLNQPDGTAAHSNIIRKRYVEEDREVIVSRSVLEDELVPHMSKGAVDNKCLWFEVEPLSSHPTTHCSLTCVVQMTVDPTAALNVPAIDVQTALETFMQQMSLTDDWFEPKTGMFHIVPKSLEHPAVPNPIHLQLDRGRIFLTALEDEINRAVRLDNHFPFAS